LRCSADTGHHALEAERIEIRHQRLALRVVDLVHRHDNGLAERFSIWARSRSAEVISVRPSTTKMIWLGRIQGHASLPQDLGRDGREVVTE
jgi:predicted ABC-type ATPase